MKAVWIIIIIIAVLIVAAICRSIYEIHSLSVSRYSVKSKKVLPENGMKVVFLSDLHGCSYGKHNEKLIELIRCERPDAILLGGDLVVSNNPSKDYVALNLVKELPKIAPVFLALGNHGKAVTVLNEFKERNKLIRDVLNQNKIILLENAKASLTPDIDVFGLDVDYKYYKKIHPVDMTGVAMKDYLKPLDDNKFGIVLAHNPMFFEHYIGCKIDLVLSGHLHGGTARIPGIGGIISPQFKLFPKLDKGMFVKDNTTMIVTSGCGSHTVNVRLFNKPEIVVIDIKGERGVN